MDWSAFDGFTRPVEQRSWSGVAAWTSAIEAQLGTHRDALARLRRSWDDSLVDLGGDPSARDWTSFRTLRREREEDWSDWLAQLIEDSKSGRFASFLLGTIEHRSAPSDYLVEEVHREVPYELYVSYRPCEVPPYAHPIVDGDSGRGGLLGGAPAGGSGSGR